MTQHQAICYGVGVGPGGNDHLTLGAVKILQTVDVVIAMQAKGHPSRAKQIIMPIVAGRDITFIDYPLVMAPRSANNLDAYKNIIPPITKYLDEGISVAVLCEGDPLFYGSFQYIMQLLPQRYDCMVIPAVTSPQLAAAQNKISLAAGKNNLSFIAATSAPEKILALLAASDRAVIMKLGKSLPKIIAILQQLNLLDAAILCIELGNDNQKIMPLKNWHQETAPYFSLLIIDKKND